MYFYTDYDGTRGTIVFQHVTSVFRENGNDIFKVYLDDCSDEPVEVPSECYNGFIEKLGEYITRKG